jgi:hypothetical protein
MPRFHLCGAAVEAARASARRVQELSKMSVDSEMTAERNGGETIKQNGLNMMGVGEDIAVPARVVSAEGS